MLEIANGFVGDGQRFEHHVKFLLRSIIIVAGCIFCSLADHNQSEYYLIYGYTYDNVSGGQSTRTSELILESLGSGANTSRVFLPKTKYTGRQSISFDPEEVMVYISAKYYGTYKIGFDGGEPEMVFKSSGAIAVDWITKNIYIGNDNGEIRVFEPNRQEFVTLIEKSEFEVHEIVLQLQDGFMYWTAVGSVSVIYKASLDGTMVTRIHSHVTKRHHLFFGIMLDHVEMRLYWKNGYDLWTSNLDGGDAYALGTITAIGQCITVTSGSIYWTDGVEIKTCSTEDKCSRNTTVVTVERNRVSWFDDMIVTHPGRNNQRRVNPCASNPCSHICVLTLLEGHKCICPEGFIFSKDGSNCVDLGPKLLILSNLGVQRLSLTNLKVQNISTRRPWAATFDSKSETVYFEGPGLKGPAIFRTDMDFKRFWLVGYIGSRAFGLAYDWIGENVYYTTGEQVGLCSLNGKNCTVVFHCSSTLRLRNCIWTALDPNHG